MACLPADVAVSRESATLILLRATGASLALKTEVFLAVLLRLLPASALALALAWLVPRLWLQAAWLAQPTTATARLPVISTHERRVIPLSDKLSFMQRGRRTHLYPLCVVHHVNLGRSGAGLRPQSQLGIVTGSGGRQ